MRKKIRQIGQICEVYSQAQEVHTWLGGGTSDTENPGVLFQRNDRPLMAHRTIRWDLVMTVLEADSYCTRKGNPKTGLFTLPDGLVSGNMCSWNQPINY